MHYLQMLISDFPFAVKVGGIVAAGFLALWMGALKKLGAMLLAFAGDEVTRLVSLDEHRIDRLPWSLHPEAFRLRRDLKTYQQAIPNHFEISHAFLPKARLIRDVFISRKLVSIEGKTLDYITFAKRLHRDSRARCVILAPPGAGKTTLAKQLVVSLLENSKSNDTLQTGTDREFPWVPVYVNLARPSSTSVRVAIINEFTDLLGEKRATSFATQLIKRGRLIVLFDSLDEVGPLSGQLRENVARRHEVQRSINEFCHSFMGAVVVLCRNENFDQSDFRSTLPESYRLLPFTSVESRELLRRLLSHRKMDANHVASQLELASVFGAFAADPMQITLLAGLMETADTAEIPSNRTEIYYQATANRLKALTSTGARTQFFNFPEEKRRILETLACDLIVKGAAKPMAFDDQVLQQASGPVLESRVATALDARQLGDELVTVNGLLERNPSGHYSFTHKTFAEYFAASAVHRAGSGSDGLQAVFHRSDLREVHYFLAGLVDTADLRRLVFGLLDHDLVVSAAGCLLHAKPGVHMGLADIVVIFARLQALESRDIFIVIEVLAGLSRRGEYVRAAEQELDRALKVLMTNSAATTVGGKLRIALEQMDAGLSLRVRHTLLFGASREWTRCTAELMLRALDEGSDPPTETESELAQEIANIIVQRNNSVAAIEFAYGLASRLPKHRRTVDLIVRYCPDLEGRHPRWPVDDILPARIAVPVVRALSNETLNCRRTTGNAAFDCARSCFMLTSDGLEAFVRPWAGIDTVLAAQRMRVKVIKWLRSVGFWGAWITSAILALLSLMSTVENTPLVLYRDLHVLRVNALSFSNAVRASRDFLAEGARLRFIEAECNPAPEKAGTSALLEQEGLETEFVGSIARALGGNTGIIRFMDLKNVGWTSDLRGLRRLQSWGRDKVENMQMRVSTRVEVVFLRNIENLLVGLPVISSWDAVIAPTWSWAPIVMIFVSLSGVFVFLSVVVDSRSIAALRLPDSRFLGGFKYVIGWFVAMLVLNCLFTFAGSMFYAVVTLGPYCSSLVGSYLLAWRYERHEEEISLLRSLVDCPP